MQFSILASLLPPFIDTYSLYHLSNVTPCASSSICLSFGQFVWVPSLSILRMVQNIFQGGSPGVYLFDKIYVAEFGFERFSCLLRYSFLTFSLISVWWCLLPIFPGICNFTLNVLRLDIIHVHKVINIFLSPPSTFPGRMASLS